MLPDVASTASSSRSLLLSAAKHQVGLEDRPNEQTLLHISIHSVYRLFNLPVINIIAFLS